MVRRTSDKQIFRTFQGTSKEITVFKDLDLFNKSAFFNLLVK